jgi:ribonuclease J
MVSDRWSDIAQTLSNGVIDVNWVKLRADVEAEMRRLLRRELQSNPTLVFLLQTPIEPPANVTRRQRSSSTKVASVAS